MAAACIFILHPVPLLTLHTARMHCVRIVRKDMQCYYTLLYVTPEPCLDSRLRAGEFN